MQTMGRISLILCMLGLVTAASGCLFAGNYHSAKTLGKGRSAFGMTLSATQYKFISGAGEVRDVQVLNFLPEITYHRGLTDNLDVGGRVHFIALEGDLKYRLHQSDNLHLAVVPALGIQGLLSVGGTILRLPVVATYELSESFAIMGATSAGISRHTPMDPDNNGDDSAFAGTLASVGGSIGLELSGDFFVIRLGIEFSRYVASFDNEQFEPFKMVNAMVHLAFIGGREKRPLDRM